MDARPKKKSVADTVADELQRAISAGKYRPGDRLPSENQLCAQLGLHGDAGLPVKTEQKCLPGCAQKADLRIIVFDGSGVAGGNADFVSECDTDDHRLAAVGDAGAAVAHACGVTLKKEIDAQHKCDKGRSQHDQRQNLTIA